ncbi:hypothetical protein MPTK1_8g17130 [Marchantia polymorpha subsp. ruderalis]|uniref:Uncharacterized protein n=1 Tax=Marchantia polymorpha TaxID=3197 RepID=A0A2R6X877_MARPO|nr:hypothetical protein MARPO_0030s0045 [Marchantia polymorpha]BBN20184.1 hypothetical protein Mp_8g17130 [Marchantia polymorpha subsp. ruderalis]|eukprot:PTQ42300.1 hypothetical protein MARPO_0030s0045 [Marchantia polymorpha]
MEGHEAGWEGVQRQGQVIGDFLNAFGQGLGGMFHDHMRPATTQISRVYCDGQSASRWSWPWPNARNLGINSSPARLKHDKKTWQPVPKRMISTLDFAIHTIGTRVRQAGAELGACLEHTQLFAMNTVGSRVGQAGADLGACLEQLAGNVLQHLPRPFYRTPSLTLSMSGPSSYTGSVDCVRPAIADLSKVEGGSAERNILWVSSTSTSSSKSPKYANGPNGQSSHTTDDELDSIISGSPLHKRSNVVVTTTYDSQTQEIESSLVARGDLWRVEASHGGPSTPGSGNTLLFLLQLGPVLFVRDTTILVPMHLSKKNGLHSLCFAVWSKHRRWLSMSMISLNPISCSFLDLQFPNGQLTYVAGEGVTGSAFLPAFGGLLQAQGRLPGNTKISYFYKNMWGTRFSPGIQLPDKSVSLGILQPLA